MSQVKSASVIIIADHPRVVDNVIEKIVIEFFINNTSGLWSIRVGGDKHTGLMTAHTVACDALKDVGVRMVNTQLASQPAFIVDKNKCYLVHLTGVVPTITNNVPLGIVHVRHVPVEQLIGALMTLNKFPHMKALAVVDTDYQPFVVSRYDLRLFEQFYNAGYIAV